MTEIPADIIATARKLEEEFWSQSVPQGSEITVSGFISRAILAERERCAGVVSDVSLEWFEDGGLDLQKALGEVLNEIIRGAATLPAAPEIKERIE